jgi:tRNA threonylcarbamoyladenosine biosynthesis protein TsaB
MLLAIDTATRHASVALYREADAGADAPGGVLAEYTWYSANRHSVQLAPTVDEMLRRQGLSAMDLTAVGVALGPGSFTGLRIGVSVAKGLCLALGIPIVGVPTLDAMAYAPRSRLPVWAFWRPGATPAWVPTVSRDGLAAAPRGEIALVSAAN